MVAFHNHVLCLFSLSSVNTWDKSRPPEQNLVDATFIHSIVFLIHTYFDYNKLLAIVRGRKKKERVVAKGSGSVFEFATTTVQLQEKEINLKNNAQSIKKEKGRKSKGQI